jgi:hypothetical protein
MRSEKKKASVKARNPVARGLAIQTGNGGAGPHRDRRCGRGTRRQLATRAIRSESIDSPDAR